MKKDKLVILDRDGTINVDKHYLSDPEALEILPGAIEGLQSMAEDGFRFGIATNQSGIGRGYFSVDTLDKINERLLGILSANNIVIEALAYCPHTPDDQCLCRKPRPGLANKIADDMNILLGDATVIVIGDREGDIGLANNIGAKSIFLTDSPDTCQDFGQTASAISLMEASSIIRRWM